MIVRALNKVSFKEMFRKWAYQKTGGLLKSGGVKEKRQKGINGSNFFCFCSFNSPNVAIIVQGVNSNNSRV